MTTNERNEHHNSLSLLLLLLLFVSVYARFVPQLGIYWDDYQAFYLIGRFGLSSSYSLALSQGRPIAAIGMYVLHSLFPIAHWIMAFVILANALMYRQVLRWIFPSVPVMATIAAVLYLVTPVVWMSAHLTNVTVEAPLFVGLLSLVLSRLSFDMKGIERWIVMFASLFLIPSYLYFYEIILILEFVRFSILLRYSYSKDVTLQQHLLLSFRRVLPWALVALAFFIHRFFIFQPTGYYAGYAQLDSALFENPLHFLASSLSFLYSNAFVSWQHVVQEVLSNATLLLAPSILSILVFLYLMYTMQSIPKQRGDRLWLVYLLTIIFGFTLAYLANLAVAISGRGASHVIYGVITRFQVTAQLGMIAIWTGTLFLLTNLRGRFLSSFLVSTLMAILVYFGASARITYHQMYIAQWNDKNALMSSLSDVIPDFRGDTTIIYNTTLTDFIVDEFTYQPVSFIDQVTVSWLYGREDLSFITSDYVLVESPPEIMPVRNFSGERFETDWAGDLSRSILIYADNRGCVHLINPYEPLAPYPDVGRKLRSLALHPEIPNPNDLIITHPTSPAKTRTRYFPKSLRPNLECMSEMETDVDSQSVMLLDYYNDNIPVIIEDAEGRLNTHLPHLMFAEVDDDSFIHIVDPSYYSLYDGYVDTSSWISPNDTNTTLNRIGDSPSIWLIRDAYYPSITEELHEILLDRGYYATETLEQHTLFLTDFTLIRYEMLDDTQTVARFGEEIELVYFEVPSINDHACGLVLIKSWWRAKSSIPITYSVTYSFLGPDGTAVARSDGQLSWVPSSEWDENAIYVDERELELPCAFDEGSYELTFGVYDWRDGIRLPVTIDGIPTGRDLASIETYTFTSNDSER